jgi:lambda family phage portal protein
MLFGGARMGKKVSVLNKVISYFAPGLALKRELAARSLQILNSGYSHHGADRRKASNADWSGDSRSPREDIDENLSLLRERSRDLVMGGANIATGALRTKRTNVVGPGLRLKPTIDYEFLKMSDEDAKTWERTVTREFEFYAGSVNCDSMRLNNFYELQALAFYNKMLSGDVFALLPYKPRPGFPYDLRIQLLEADRIGTPPDKLLNPDISQGVEVKDGEVKAYYIFNMHPGRYDFDNTYKRVPAFGARTGRRNVLHLMDAERVGQSRGVPILAPVMESLRQVGSYTQAELRAAVVGSLMTVFVKTITPEGATGEESYAQEDDDKDKDPYKLGYGSIVQLGVDEDISVAAPGRPNTAFDGFVNSIFRQIGAALGIPFELLQLHFGASYSASRGALLEAWKEFRAERTWFANDFCQPVYEEWLAEAVAKGRIYAPGFFNDPVVRAAYCKAEWHGPSQGQLDPLKEVNAARVRINEGLSTREREAAELTGTDFNTNHRQRVREEKMRKELNGPAPEGGETNDEGQTETRQY